jgi:hypothetical protein
MKFLYLAHIPFVALFLLFVAGFAWANLAKRR